MRSLADDAVAAVAAGFCGNLRDLVGLSGNLRASRTAVGPWRRCAGASADPQRAPLRQQMKPTRTRSRAGRRLWDAVGL